MNTILLVEDDISLANWVSEYLTEQAFDVIHVERGDLVLDKIKNNAVDLVLLDIMLPGLNGIEVCRLIRQHCQLPIIMLTARADEFDEVIGLEAGANDYVIKPVRPRALLARINRQLSNQQPESSASSLLTFGELTINQEAKRVTYCNQEIELSSSLFAFLTFLAERAGSVVDSMTVKTGASMSCCLVYESYLMMILKNLKNLKLYGEKAIYLLVMLGMVKIFKNQPLFRI